MKRLLLILLLLASMNTSHGADGDAAGPAYESAKKAADQRYSEDQKLCADESTPSRRMQCLRDAKEEHTRAMVAATSKLEQAGKPGPAAVCTDCAKVIAVRMSEKDGEGSAGGMIVGGVAGALLGRQVGKGTGKDLATIAGAAGGAYAGHKIEGKMNKVRTWTVTVRFDNGDERAFNFDHDPGMVAGDAVRAAGNSIVRR